MKAQEILKSVKLPTLSKSLYRILELEEKNTSTLFIDIKQIIEKDPLLSAHILKVANSPFYGFSQQVRTIAHAISLLGIQKIKNIAFAYSVFDFIKRISFQPQYGKTFNHLLKKSLLISSVSTILAKQKHFLYADEISVAGLLTEIGQIILFLYAPEKYSALQVAGEDQLAELERRVFGFDHIETGIAVAETWNLPEVFRSVIANHHTLQHENEYSKIIYVATQIADWLLIEDEREKQLSWSVPEQGIREHLGLTLTEVEEAVRSLPQVIDSFIRDFPEVQKDLQQIIDTSSTLILSLMKKEMDLALLTQELSETQTRLTKEKNLLAHLLNLSYFFSSLLPPARIIQGLFDYFGKFIEDLSIEFICKDDRQRFRHFTAAHTGEGPTIDTEAFESLKEASLTSETLVLKENEVQRLDPAMASSYIVFTISYHHNLFGFLLLKLPKERRLSDVEISHIRILANIIANSFQNFYSFENLKKEINKKEILRRELVKFDEALSHSQEALNESQRSEVATEILPVIFHKLKNKLTPILGYAQILVSRSNDEFFRKRLGEIERNANELTELFNILRDYFHIESKARESGNLNAILHGLQHHIDQVAAREGISVTLDTDPALSDMMMVQGQIEALFLNVFENAVHALRAKGHEQKTIHIATRRESSGDVLIVRDNGIGIPEEEQAKIWNPFFSTFGNRAGLGLSICEKIAANHDGRIELQSAPGQFTEVRVTFPPTTAPAPQPEPSTPEPAASTTAVLLVDRDEYLLDLLRDILLSENNYTITTASSQGEALEILRAREFDLVIADSMDGRAIHEFLQAERQGNRLLILMNEPAPLETQRFLQEYAVPFLKKPFELMRFKNKVSEMIRQ